MKSEPIQLALLYVVAWVAGVVTYIGALAAIYRQSISSGDLVAVLVWSAVGFLLSFVVIYLPVLFALRRVLGGVRPAWPFPLVAALLGIAPTAFVLLCWGSGLRSLVSREASLFYVMFSVVGVIIGFGYVRIYHQVA